LRCLVALLGTADKIDQGGRGSWIHALYIAGHRLDVNRAGKMRPSG
jgi:hypothetical protein